MHEPVPAVQLDNEAVWEAILPRLRETVLAGRFILGDEVAEFEEAAARFFGCDWAVGTSSGTSALTLALRAAGLKLRSRVGLPANTFFATFEAIVSAGHIPVVLDVDDDYLIGPQELEGQTLDALVPVHLFGLPVDMPAVMELASENGWWVLEDCSQAHGATIGGKSIGSFGHAGGFSAYPTKNLGAWGDAGFVTGSDPQLRSEIEALRHHGQHVPNVHDAIAGAHRLDSIQALVLLEKLKRLPQEVEVRRTIATWYREGLADLPIAPPDDIGSRRHAYHQFVVRVPDREGVRHRLQELGVGTGIHYPTPVHLQPGAHDMCDVPMRPRNAERLCEQILSLPMYPQITRIQVDRVASALSKAIS